MPGIVSIVGRPNVGKSTLFNRLVGRRVAIVHDQPGVTRDRISVEAEWHGIPYTLVDTGGMGLVHGEKARNKLEAAVAQQVEIAIETADLLLLVVDTQEGIMPLDRDISERLRRAGKPVFIIANKVDNKGMQAAADEFAELGFDRIFPISAIHGGGMEPLMKETVQLLKRHAAETGKASPQPGMAAVPAPSRQEPESPQTAQPLKLAIVGRPNVGKSSLINALTHSERVIVTPIAGTTRDAVDVPLSVSTEGVRQEYLLIDTAGVRKQRKLQSSIEFFGIKRMEQTIARCDIAILVLDATEGVTELDKKLGGQIVEDKKACVIVVNKWDLFADQVLQVRRELASQSQGRGHQHSRTRLAATSLADFGRWVQERLFFLDYAPVLFTSAQSGFHLDRLLEAVRFVAAQLQQKIPTPLLNRALRDAISQQPLKGAGGRPLKLFYATQTQQAPPTFLLFVNRHESLSENSAKSLARALRRSFGYEGCPIELRCRARPRTGDPLDSPS